jgi:predicted MFS family arabinose efflux permease
MIFLLFLGEFAPAAGLTIADTVMVKACKTYSDDVAQWCHGIRLMGKAISAIVGSIIQQNFGYTAVFFLQCILCFLLTFFLFLCVLAESCPSSTLLPQDEEEKEEAPLPPSCLPLPSSIRGGISIRDLISRHEYPYLAVLTCTNMMPSTGGPVFYFLSGPIDLPPSLFGIQNALDVAAVFGSCFVWRSWTIADLTYAYIVFTLIMSIPMVWIIARQNLIDDSLILITTSFLSSFVTSMLVTRIAIENSKTTPEGKEGVYYALYSCIPGFGRVIGTATSSIYTDYFRVNHDNFDQLAMFNSLSLFFQTLNAFLPIMM